MRRTSQRGIDLIKSFEGFSPTKYPDGHGYSIGHGTFIDKPSEQYLLTATISRSEAEALLRRDVERFERAVNEELSGISQEQFDALVSLTYNIGVSAFKGSTLLRLAKANPNDPNIREAFMMWKKSRGKILNALIDRRRKEANLYFSNTSSPITKLKRSSLFLIPLLLVVALIVIE